MLFEVFVSYGVWVVVCTKVFIEILVWGLHGKSLLKWDKTVHKGVIHWYAAIWKLVGSLHYCWKLECEPCL